MESKLDTSKNVINNFNQNNNKINLKTTVKINNLNNEFIIKNDKEKKSQFCNKKFFKI